MTKKLLNSSLLTALNVLLSYHEVIKHLHIYIVRDLKLFLLKFEAEVEDLTIDYHEQLKLTIDLQVLEKQSVKYS